MEPVRSAFMRLRRPMSGTKPPSAAILPGKGSRVVSASHEPHEQHTSRHQKPIIIPDRKLLSCRKWIVALLGCEGRAAGST
eukprot:185059-Rhodomonas_salina.1